MTTNIVRCRAGFERDIQDLVDRLCVPGVHEEAIITLKSTDGVLSAEFTNTLKRRYDKN